MAQITQVKAREILDSRGIPTVETTLFIEGMAPVSSSSPSGTSTGSYEAVELRDQDPKRYQGNGVLQAVRNINELMAPQLTGKDPTHQTEIDQFLVDLDGTKNKSKLGANAILSVSQAVCKAGAKVYNMELYQYIKAKYQLSPQETRIPTPIFNVINGGKHGAGNLDFQEFHVIPSTRMAFSGALQSGQEIYRSMEEVLKKHGAIHSVGVEGGFAPNLYKNSDALELMVEAIRSTDLKYGEDVFLGLDIAASNFYKSGKYRIKDQKEPLSTKELIEYYKKINDDYRLYSLEDALHEDDWSAWSTLTTEIGSNTVIIGDDLLTSNIERTQKAIETKACSAILTKPNQVGTISQTVQVISLANKAGWQVIISHRSGETNDDFIADFAVGVGAQYCKFGAPARGERVAKYNRLLMIEELLKSNS